MSEETGLMTTRSVRHLSAAPHACSAQILFQEDYAVVEEGL